MFKFFINRELSTNTLEIYGSEKIGLGKHATLKPMIQKIQEEDFRTEPFIKLPIQECTQFIQSFIDEAWEYGVKPTKIKDNEGELKATKYHLEDMRTIATKRGKT